MKESKMGENREITRWRVWKEWNTRGKVTNKRRGEGEEVIEVSTVFVAVTREAGVFSGTPSPQLAPQLVTLALQPRLILRRPHMTDRRLTFPHLSLGLWFHFLFLWLHRSCRQLKVFLEWLRNFWETPAVLFYYAGFSGLRLTEVNTLKPII